MHFESVDSPHSLRRTYVPCINKRLNFIIVDHMHISSSFSWFLSHFDICLVMSFVNIFEKVLDTFNGGTNFNVQMAVVFEQKVWVVRHYPGVVYGNSCSLSVERLAIVSTLVYGVPIDFSIGEFLK